MKKLLATICAGAVLGLMASCDDAPGKAKAYNQGINIIPTPVSLTQNEGNFKLNKNTKIYASTPETKTVAEFFAAKMNTATGYQIATADKETSDGISLVIDGSLDVNDEGYTLDVADSGVRIKAKTPQGLFYGMQSFLQLLPAEIESPSAVKGMDRSGRIYQGRASIRLPWYHARPLPPFHPGREYQEAAGCIGLVQDQPHALAPDRRPRMAYRDQEVPETDRDRL